VRRVAAWFPALCLAAAIALPASAADDEGASEIELTEPGTHEEMTVESEDKPPPPKPAAAPAPAPAPKPAPPKPKPVPKPVVPKSPWEWLVLESFDKAETGKDVGTLRRTAGVQFTARVTSPGHDGLQALTLQGVPSLAEGTAWVWTPADGKPVDLSVWRGVSLWVKASQPAGELRIGVAGGGSVFAAFPLGVDWTEVRLDFARDAGRGRFDPSRATAIVLAVAHELPMPVEVTVDTVAAWRERVPSDALRLGLNVPPVAGPGDWTPDFRAVNCAGRSSAAEGFVLRFWTGEVPYAHRPIVAAWNDLPRGLKGVNELVAQMRLEPAQPQVVLKWTLIEQGGEKFSVLRVLPSDAPIRIPLGEFLWDTIENLRTPPVQVGNGLLDPADVAGWRLEILPATERACKAMVVVKELWAEGRMKPGPRPVVRAPARPVARPAAAASAPAAPAAAPKPAAAPAAPAEGEETIGDEEATAPAEAAPKTEAGGEAAAGSEPAKPPESGAAPEGGAAPDAGAAPAEQAPAPGAPADEAAPEEPGQ